MDRSHRCFRLALKHTRPWNPECRLGLRELLQILRHDLNFGVNASIYKVSKTNPNINIILFKNKKERFKFKFSEKPQNPIEKFHKFEC